MIKVIKHGQKTFKKVCSSCGCEFEFDVTDLQDEWCLNSYPSYKRRYVVCPDCGERIYHDTVSVPWTNPVAPIEPWSPNKPPYITWTTSSGTSIDPCKGCPHKDGPKDGLGNPTAGDSMCEWCPNNPNKWTCTNNTSHVMTQEEREAFFEDR